MTNSKEFQQAICDEYQRRYPLKEDAMFQPAIIKICARLIAIAFEISSKEDAVTDHSD